MPTKKPLSLSTLLWTAPLILGAAFLTVTLQAAAEECADCAQIEICPADADDAITVTYLGMEGVVLGDIGADEVVNPHRAMTEVPSQGSTQYLVSPDPTRQDATYPQLTNINPGFLVYAPGLYLDRETRFSLCQEAEDQWALIIPNGNSAGLIFAGPSNALIQSNGFLYAANQDLSEEARNWVSEFARLSIDQLRELLNINPPRDLHLFFSALPEGSGGLYEGHHTSNGAILVLGSREFIDSDSDAFRIYFEYLITHEGAHNWNSNEVNGNRWMWEGSAEYFTRLILNTENSVHQDLNPALAGHINQCLNSVQEFPITGEDTSYYPRRDYDCGLLIHLTADLAIRRATNGEQTIFDLWHTMLSQNEDLAYSQEDFFRELAVFDVDVSQSLQDLWLSETPIEDRATHSISMLNVLGAEVATGGPDLQSQIRLWGSLVHSSTLGICPDGIAGIAMRNTSVEPHVIADCPYGIIRRFFVTNVNGFEIPGDAEAAYQDGVERCSSGGIFTLVGTGPDGQPHAAEFPCNTELPAPPIFFEIQSLGPYFN